MDRLGPFSTEPFSKNRELVIDIVKLGRTKHHVPVLFEVDVTDARNRIRLLKQQKEGGLSFTGWAVKCIAQAISENKQMHALRRGRRQVVVFDEVDVLVTVQKSVDEKPIPLPFVIRNANGKSVLQINEEILAARRQGATKSTMMLGKNPWYAKTYLSLPTVIRSLVGRRMMSSPFAVKRNTGTVGVSSIGMMGNFAGWTIPLGPLPVQVALGCIVSKPAFAGGQVEGRDFLSVAFVFDHDVVDGAPVAAFTSRLVELMQSGHGLSKADG
jgi:pyruvate/2-oxoglutarate dehydrogenase complex dihydrolipoamide acyltransferase (E2) component